MTKKITQRELRNDSGAILRAVAGGEVFVVTSNGAPVAQLVPLRRRTFVPRAELAHAAAHAPVIDLAGFRADLDAVVDQDLLGG
ncbi:type II toxin-antitoxin system prevent-host-death family antitoxin [Umezawaea sp. Da 62-37]|uniref:type II toxin-antitoxin system Phd/YefM family antitoxin n=1 Tax=Umezawaea sp. Da 62-37 TaxID=3075927 RepID=UPI0028F715FC|nr:type II toxin-antitoxin system prevent-host-death family antitoxin [Umezawaea sp. Da 62-37]WNV89840.1 type II toxin-antitoxin system prevent-host-death family antitoxin [Umezawaea sp. Da 62-37]